MKIFRAVGFIAVEAGFGRNVDFTADNRFDAALASRLIKIDDAVHGAVIGYGERIHAESFSRVEEVADTRRAVKEAIFRVNV